MAANPYMKRYTLTLANTNYRLSNLMIATDASAPQRFNKVSIQAPLTGSQVMRIGNNDLSDTNCGIELYATQAYVDEAPTNSLSATEYYIRCNQAGKYINLSVHVL